MSKGPHVPGGGVLSEEYNIEKNKKRMNQASKFRFEFVDVNKLVLNDYNKTYAQDEYRNEAMSCNIEEYGLFHTLVVIPIDENETKYRIVSGESRYRAIMKAIDRGCRDFDDGIPCRILKFGMSDEDEQIALFSANHYNRHPPMREIRREVCMLEALYRKKKERGELSKVHESVAKEFKISTRQAIKYSNTESLVQKLVDLLDEEKISLDFADDCHNMSPSVQDYIAEYVIHNGKMEQEMLETIKSSVEVQKMIQEKCDERDKQLEELGREEELIRKELEKSKNKMPSIENECQKNESDTLNVVSQVAESPDTSCIVGRENSAETDVDNLNDQLKELMIKKTELSNKWISLDVLKMKKKQYAVLKLLASIYKECKKLIPEMDVIKNDKEALTLYNELCDSIFKLKEEINEKTFFS